MKNLVLGRIVHFGDGEGNQHQGEIVAAWTGRAIGSANVEAALSGAATQKGIDLMVAEVDTRYAEESIRVTVLCHDRRYREAWLTNCTDGTIPKKEDEDE